MHAAGPLALFLTLSAQPAWAADVIVGPTGTWDTIQEGIDNAADGDRVLIQAGTYVESPYVLSRTLIIESISGKDVTTVMAEPGLLPSEHTHFEVTAGSSVEIRGLTLDAAGLRRGVGVWVDSYAWLDNVTVSNGLNIDSYPGGNLDLFDNSTALLTHTTLESGAAGAGVGGNAAVESNCFLNLGEGTVLSLGSASRGGGLWVDGAGGADVVNTAVANNSAVGTDDNDGGGICAEWGADLYVESSTFTGNSAGWDDQSGGGAIFSIGSLVVVSDSIFESNQAHYGGGVVSEWGNLVVSSGSFTANFADKGGAIGCANSAVCALVGTTLQSNTAERGGAVFAVDSGTELSSSTFCYNVAVPTSSPTSESDGGAIHQSRGQLTLRNNVFALNTASSDGGAIAAGSAGVDSLNNHYLGNSAADLGGAVHARDTLGLALQATSRNDFYLSNAAVLDGGVHIAVGLLNGVDFGLFYDNNPNPGTLGLLPNNIVGVDPMLSGWDGVSCDPASMRADPGSPLTDGGDPGLLDADGSRSDIGAFTDGNPTTGTVDADGDGIPDLLDCDPTQAGVGLPTRWYADDDGDGWGADDNWIVDCAPPVGWLSDGGDCDDTDPSVNPSTIWYVDEDGDGWGGQEVFQACAPGDGYTDNGVDCNDGDPSIGSPSLVYADADGDGHGTGEGLVECFPGPGQAPGSGDCDDSDYGVYPGAPELCDGVDQNCNGVIDDDPIDAVTGYLDADGDGYGTPDQKLTQCELDGLVDDDTDCDDSDASIHPGADDPWYDGVDSDCARNNDFDADQDGHEESVDCDDTDPSVHPGAIDALNDGIDQDCDDLDPKSWIAGGGACGCSQGAAPTGGLWVLGLLALAGRRRRAVVAPG